MTTGEPLRVRAAMKPISTVPRALRTVDVATGEAAVAHHQRSDVCAVPAAGVVAEAMVALVLAEAALEKFGGDSVAETAAQPRGLPRLRRWPDVAAERERPGAHAPAAACWSGRPARARRPSGALLADRLGVPFRDTDAGSRPGRQDRRRDLRRRRRGRVPGAGGGDATLELLDSRRRAAARRRRGAGRRPARALRRAAGRAGCRSRSPTPPAGSGSNQARPLLLGNVRGQLLGAAGRARARSTTRSPPSIVDTDGRTPDEVADADRWTPVLVREPSATRIEVRRRAPVRGAGRVGPAAASLARSWRRRARVAVLHPPPLDGLRASGSSRLLTRRGLEVRAASRCPTPRRPRPSRSPARCW